jgi:hypothetical protein
MILNSHAFFKQAAQFGRSQIDVPEPMIDLLQTVMKAGEGGKARAPFVAPTNPAVLAYESRPEAGEVIDQRAPPMRPVRRNPT